MRSLLVLVVTFSIIIAIALTPSLLVAWTCISAGMPGAVMAALLLPTSVVGAFLGMGALGVILDSDKFEKLLG